MMTELSLFLLGPPRIEVDGEPIRLRRHKATALLAYLAVTALPHRRDTLSTLLWPELDQSRARAALRRTLVSLNRTPIRKWLQSERESIGLAQDRLWVDVGRFQSLLNRNQIHAHTPGAVCLECTAVLAEAVSLVRDEFLAGWSLRDSPDFDTWQFDQAQRLREKVAVALEQLVQSFAGQRDYRKAIEYAQRWVALDSLHEPAHQHLMRLYALEGRRGAALHQYQECARILADELGAEPEAATRALYAQIQAGELLQETIGGQTRPPSTARHNLPVQLTSFVGRETELSAIARCLADPACRLLTLVGPGGIGKTRLAVQAASNARDDFANGIAFVDLAPLSSAEFIAPTAAASLGFTPNGRAAPRTQLLHYLRQQEVLLVLDNFEHLLASPPLPQTQSDENEAIDLLADILQHAPGATLLVTSRERLNLQGEWVFDVGGLETPAEERSLHPEAHSATMLFLQRARRVQTGFDATPEDQSAIWRICRLVQGMPLAIELAATWVRVLPCREIAREIEKNIGFLTTTVRDLPERHRSMRAVFDHSWKLLSEAERHAFAHCSVFRGGFTREAAAHVAGVSLSILAGLVDKSLLSLMPNGRYEFHELALHYAAGRLADSQQTASVRQRHLTYFMNYAETAEPEIRSGRQVSEWHDWIDLDHDNLRAALDWSYNAGEFEPGMRIVGALWEFWMNRGHAHEGQTQAERFLARAEAAEHPRTRARTMYTAAACAYYQGHYLTAYSLYAQGIALSRELGAGAEYTLALMLLGQVYTLLALSDLGDVEALCLETLNLGLELQDSWLRGHALLQLGILRWNRGDITSAHRDLLDSVRCFEADGYSVMRGAAMRRLGIMLFEEGDYAAADTHLARALAIFQELGDKTRAGGTLRHLGYLAMVQGKDGKAQELLEQSLVLARQTATPPELSKTLDAVGRLAQRQGNFTRAQALHRESLTSSVEQGHQGLIVRSLEAFACLAVRQGQVERAASLFGTVDAYSASAGVQFDLMRVVRHPIGHTEHDRLVAVARTELGEAAFTAAWAEGAAMDLDEAIDYALEHQGCSC